LLVSITLLQNGHWAPPLSLKKVTSWS